jgi:hypothetical protein
VPGLGIKPGPEERIFVFVAACHVRAKSLSLVGGGTAYLNIELKDLGRPQPRANRKQISTSQMLISATAEISARP